jgi:hypothetical protein
MGRSVRRLQAGRIVAKINKNGGAGPAKSYLPVAVGTVKSAAQKLTTRLTPHQATGSTFLIVAVGSVIVIMLGGTRLGPFVALSLVAVLAAWALKATVPTTVTS